MARYIDGEKLELEMIKAGRVMQCSNSARDSAYFVHQAPTADVKPVVRGTWKRNTDYMGEPMECSICGSLYIDTNFNFCPDCGADMREEQTT